MPLFDENPPEVFGEFLLVRKEAPRSAIETALAVKLGDRTGRPMLVRRPILGERASGEAAQALGLERDLLKAARHRSLVVLEAEGTLAGLPFVAVEHVRGVPLADVLREGPLPRAAVAGIARDLAEALAAIHGAGFALGRLDATSVLADDGGEVRLVDLSGARRLTDGANAAALDVEAWAGLVAAAATGTVPGDAARARSLFPPLDLVTRRDQVSKPDARALAASLASLEASRHEVAERVQRAQSRPVPRATAKADATLLSRSAVTPPRAPRPKPAPGGRTRLVAILAATFGLGVGLVLARSGRAPERATTATVTLVGQLPRRASVELDGHPISAEALASPIPVAPGRHTVTVTLPRGEAREYTVQVNPGERIVVVPVSRSSMPPWEEGGP